MKKNIMFIIGNMKNGGAERVVTNLCNSLESKYNIVLVTQKDNYDYIPDVNVIDIKELRGEKKLGIIAIWKLRELKKKYNIAASISFLTTPNVQNYLSRYNEKVIWSIRSPMSNRPKGCSNKTIRMFKWFINKVSLVVNVSEAVKRDCMENFNGKEEKNVVIPNFCEYNQIQKQSKENIPEQYRDIFKGNVVISVGRFTPQKGHWHLIRAFKKVVKYEDNARLVILGRGELKEYYLELIKILNLEKNVFILNFDSNPYKYIKLSKLMVNTSFYEGMPNVILESFALHVPVIATDCIGGTKEILDAKPNIGSQVKEIVLSDYGVLIPTCDGIMYKNEELTKEEAMIADSIILLLSNRELYDKYKHVTYERIKDFDKSKILSMWESIIEKETK